MKSFSKMNTKTLALSAANEWLQMITHLHQDRPKDPFGSAINNLLFEIRLSEKMGFQHLSESCLRPSSSDSNWQRIPEPRTSNRESPL